MWRDRRVKTTASYSIQTGKHLAARVERISIMSAGEFEEKLVQ